MFPVALNYKVFTDLLSLEIGGRGLTVDRQTDGRIH